eukprot:gb/GECG01007514.1/.p1 GENE.gb/GECG01007514.1/~~gb/GECG01007514.1/.p1  ORF type:complete len:471 (+),score=67.76 gb/GECG01007514.1/:1-1413(+)
MFKAKKFLASRISNTKYGRQKVADQLGERAQMMLGAVMSATAKFAEPSVATSIREDLIKIILKIALLWREQRITEKDAEPAQGPVVVLAQTLIEYITRGSAVDVTDVCELVHRVGNAAVEVLQRHMKEKNWSKIQVFKGFFGSNEFAGFFLNSSEAKEERLVFLDILQKWLPDHARRRQCSVVGCALPRVNLAGADYCIAHHAVKFSTPPVLDDFLKNSEYIKLFRSYLLEECPDKIFLLEFYFKVVDFRSLNRSNLLEERGPALFRRYIAEGARHKLPLDFNNSRVKEAAHQVAQGVMMTPPRSNVFNDILEIVFEELERIFENEFRSCEQYKEWAKENLNFPLPKMPKQREEMFEQLGLDPSVAFDVTNNRLRGHSDIAHERHELLDSSLPKARSSTFANMHPGTRVDDDLRRTASASSDSSDLSVAFLRTMRSASVQSPDESLQDKFAKQGSLKEEVSDESDAASGS